MKFIDIKIDSSLNIFEILWILMKFKFHYDFFITIIESRLWLYILFYFIYI